jgi:hypothetical protein
MNIEDIIENNIRTAKMDGYVFNCPKCKKITVRALNRDQVKQLAGAHYVSCKPKAKE